MDEDEAERLARAIRVMQLDWIRVEALELNIATNKYEVTCEYRQQEGRGLFHREQAWTPLRITSPRQWIDLLTHHDDDLELP